MEFPSGVSELAASVVAALKGYHLTLATCESLTGGLISAVITGVPGASEVYRGGLVTYASDLKSSLAGVDGEWIRDHGVINPETASRMALGAARCCRADIGIGVTGVAGPAPQDEHSPGEVWVGLALPGGVDAHRLDAAGDRDAVRWATLIDALTGLRARLDDWGS